jgi:hypothetical protein
MIRTLGLVPMILSVLLMASAAPQIDRRLDQTFRVAAGATVAVRISGGPIAVATGPAGTVTLTLDQKVDAASASDADAILADFEISAVQQGDAVTLTARRRMDAGDRFRRRSSRVRFAARLTVPADARLDLDTSGGGITVGGHRTAAVKADTSGGPIDVDGGAGDLDLDTSGGGIHVGRALGRLRADTSGGGITVEYVGADATSVLLDTSGGGIEVGVDRAARLDVTASTSGGSVSIEGLPFTSQVLRRSRASGTLNGGGGRLTADTSGGSIRIRAATR